MTDHQASSSHNAFFPPPTPLGQQAPIHPQPGKSPRAHQYRTSSTWLAHSKAYNLTPNLGRLIFLRGTVSSSFLTRGGDYTSNRDNTLSNLRLRPSKGGIPSNSSTDLCRDHCRHRFSLLSMRMHRRRRRSSNPRRLNSSSRTLRPRSNMRPASTDILCSSRNGVRYRVHLQHRGLRRRMRMRGRGT